MPLPDFASMHEELSRHKDMTLQLLWQEYKLIYPEDYQYSCYCELYRRRAQMLDLLFRDADSHPPSPP